MATKATTLIIRYKAEDGTWKRADAAYSDNGRVKSGHVVINDKRVPVGPYQYQVRYYVDRRAQYQSAGTDAQRAELLRRQIEQEQTAKAIADDAGLQVVEPDAKRETLDQAAKRYIKDRKDAKALEAAIDAELVLNGFRSVAKRRRKTYVDELVTDDIKAYLNGLACAEQTRFKRYKRLRAWFRFLGANNNLYARDLRPTFTLTSPRIYSKQQITDILAQANDRGDLAIRLGYQCGYRKQEIEFAMYRDIDWDNCTISVRDKRWSDIYPPEKALKAQERIKAQLVDAEKVGRILRLDPIWAFRVKDAEERTIPVPAELLAKLKARRAKYPNDILIVPNRDGNPDGALLGTIKGLAEKAGMGTAGVDLHTLRRTWMTTLLRNGIDIRTVQHLAGHAKLETTLRYLRPAEGDELQGKINNVNW
jgi:integrase